MAKFKEHNCHHQHAAHALVEHRALTLKINSVTQEWWVASRGLPFYKNEKQNIAVSMSLMLEELIKVVASCLWQESSLFAQILRFLDLRQQKRNLISNHFTKLSSSWCIYTSLYILAQLSFMTIMRNLIKQSFQSTGLCSIDQGVKLLKSTLILFQEVKYK